MPTQQLPPPMPPLSRPPIREVVLDFGVAYGAGRPFSVDRAQAWAVEALGASAITRSLPSPDGEAEGLIAYAAEDEQAIQVSHAGLAINLFGFDRAPDTSRPYTSWERTRAEAEPLWDTFRQAFNVERVDRLSLRYINALDFEPDATGRRALLRSWPTFSPALIGRDPSSFVMRMEVPVAGTDARATVVHALSHDDSGRVHIIIDTDILLPHYVGGIGGVWAALDRLRPIKNQLFRDALTAEALQPYL